MRLTFVFIKTWNYFRDAYRKVKHLIISFCKKLWSYRKVFLSAATIGLLISLSQNLSTRSQLEFSFSGKAGGPLTEDGGSYYQYRHGGLIKNRSKEKNTITNIGLVVWGDDDHESMLRDSYGPSWMIDNKTGEKIKLPLVIEGREAVDVDIFNKFIVEGTEDEKLLSTVKRVGPPGSIFTIPAYDYQLTFTDINNNEFDEQGRLVNRDIVDMNWTLSNYCGENRYKFWSCQIQRIKIIDCKIFFFIKTTLHWFGVESIGDVIYQLGTNFEK